MGGSVMPLPAGFTLQRQTAEPQVQPAPEVQNIDVVQPAGRLPEGFTLAKRPSVEQQKFLSPRAQKQLSASEQAQLLEARSGQLEAAMSEKQAAEIGPSASVRAEQSFAELQKQNPQLAEIIQDLSPLQAALIGFQQGMRTVARGAGKLVGADVFPEVTGEELKTLQEARPAAKVGRVAGEAAPFAAAAPLTGTIGTGLRVTRGGAQLVPQVTSTSGRAAATGALGATEGAAISAGEDRTAGEVATGALLGGVIGAGAEILPALRGRRAAETSSELVSQGEELLRRLPKDKDIDLALTKATPTIEQLLNAANDIFGEVAEAGITIKPDTYRALTARIRKEAETAGLDAVNTPQANRAIQRLEELIGDEPSFNQLNQIRETAQVAAGNLQVKKEAALGSRIIDSIDEFLTTVDNNQIQGGNVGNRIKVARELWGRGRRSQLIDEAVEKAKRQATGFENGIRTQFRSILNNKKKSKFFSKEEINAMNKVVDGSKSANLYKFLGRMAPTEGQATSFLGASIGAGGGAALGSALSGAAGAGVGAVALPVIGIVSRGLAQKITAKNAQLANRVIRAGRDADRIAKAYIASVPKSQRSADELSQLLLRQDVDLDLAKSELARDAAQIARKRRAELSAGTISATGAVAAQDEE